MRSMKRGLAALLAALLMLPSQPVMAEKLQTPVILQEDHVLKASPSGAEKKAEDVVEATLSNAQREKVIFNTGSCEFSVVNYEDFMNHEIGDAYFQEDGSYTINIPEENPFFPYEVQFTYDGTVTNEWFMTPEDSVEIGGHTFYVSAYFDGSVVTQMTLEVAGDPVIVYPEKKKFTKGDGTMENSLLPLETRQLTVDLPGYTPAELSMISLASIFTGDEELEDKDKVVWTTSGTDDYTISSSGDIVDLSYYTCYGYETWEMIVGEDDQLAGTNIRYYISVNMTESKDWLIPTVYRQTDAGKRFGIQVTETEYYDYRNNSYYGDDGSRELQVIVPYDELEEDGQAYIGLEVNPSIFSDPQYDSLKVYEGEFRSVEEAQDGVEITDQIFNAEMAEMDAGYLLEESNLHWITLVTFDAEGKATGCLPIDIWLCRGSSSEVVSPFNSSVSVKTEDGWENVTYSRSSYEYYEDEDDCYTISNRLDIGYPAAAIYYLTMNYQKSSAMDNSEVTAAYAGWYTSISEAEKADGENIKSVLFGDGSTGGYAADYSNGIYFTIFIGDDNARDQRTYHCYVIVREASSYITTSILDKTESGWTNIGNTQSFDYQKGDDCNYITKTLKSGYPASADYYLAMDYQINDTLYNSKVTSAYVGRHSSISKANQSGAKNIKNELFGDGYAADYSKGVYFTIFIGEDSDENQEIYHYCIKAKELETYLNGNTNLRFTGLKDENGMWIDSYVVGNNEDSYAEQNYLSILVDEDVDVTKLAPRFYISEGQHLYAEGSSTPEVSGESLHDFSDGPIQYTVSAENGEDSKNYWLQVVKATEGEGWLYINSLAAEDADTEVKGGVTYSTREAFLDKPHNYIHDILIANMGKDSISSLSAELVSETVELDDYWALKGTHELLGFKATSEYLYDYSENLSKLRIKTKDGVKRGEDVSGTLTLKSGDTVLMVLTLTGTIGDPGIVTEEIPQAVKYVPYGTMIQNSNKYSWNQVSYSLKGGKLPAGMELKPNGELYGVPTETGEFQFTVSLENSGSSFSNDRKSFTLVVNENTDINVENATDQGYNLTQRIENMRLTASEDQTVVSQGIYSEFVAVYLDGTKLKEGEDYTSESGSTRITIRNQTLKGSNETGTHTLGIEFRTKDTNTLKRAAQNYKVVKQNTGGGSGGGSGSSGGGSGSSSVPSKTTTVSVNKGMVDSVKGIITGEGSGYSHWQQDENGWKLIYADGTFACGYTTKQQDGDEAVQVAWEKVNGAWYTFGSDGYLMAGWVFDYHLNSWYYVTVESGMKTGWINDAQDHCTYYLDPATGAIATGWRQIDGEWYYFTEVSQTPTWHFDEQQDMWVYDLRNQNKPYGSMYHGESTPDGYYVEDSGIWRN